MRKKKHRSLLLFIIFFFLLYFFLFPPVLYKNLCFKPVWSLNFQEASIKDGKQDQPVYKFRVGEYFGYFNSSGELLYKDKILYDATLSDSGFINYPKVSGNLIFKDNRGFFQYSVKSFGYPVLDKQGLILYTVNTDLSGIKRIDREGDILWSTEFTSPITSLSIFEDWCLPGLLDGTIKLITGLGEIVYENVHSGSRIPVILGTALTNDQIAVISGIDPQKLMIISRDTGDYTPFFSADLKSDFRREVMMRYSEDGKYLFFEHEQDLGIFNLDKRKLSFTELPGRLQMICSSETDGTVAVSTTANDSILIFRPPNHVLYAGDMSSSDIFLKLANNQLFIGIPGLLLRVDIVEE